MSIDKTEAIVLNRFDVRETSIIVNFFSLEFGKLTGVLKGIRKEPAKFASPVELFSLNEIIFYRKRNSEVHLVSQCDLIDNFSGIRKDLVKMHLASIAMEILWSVMAQEDKNEEVFRLTLNTLKELAVTHNPDKVMTIFKIKILSLSGFKPHLDSCLLCNTRISGHAKFSISLGGLVCLKCTPKDNNARVIFRGTVATILHIERNDFRSNLNLGMNPQIKKELELVLNQFLNFHLGKELKSERALSKLVLNKEAL